MKKSMLILAASAGIFAGALSTSASAWYGDGVRVYVGPGPYWGGYHGGPAYTYRYKPHYYYNRCRWVPGHYNYAGYWIRGHRVCW